VVSILSASYRWIHILPTSGSEGGLIQKILFQPNLLFSRELLTVFSIG